MAKHMAMSGHPQNYLMGLAGDSERKIQMFYLNPEQIILFLPLNINFPLGYCSELETVANLIL